ncbi:MAG: hypothetical protein IPK99_03885 [Flavobacteriales bacterium]|nr:hypothetical protein [Flavobacteriales bacterium]
MPLALSHVNGSGHAQAWLTLLGGSFGDHVVLPTHNQQRSARARERAVASPPVFVNVHPNPSNGPVVVVCNLPEGATGGALVVRDPLGRTIHQQQFLGEVQVLDLDTRQLASGVYSAYLEADGIWIGVAKFELVH